MKIALAGTGYVGLSLAVLLAQHNEVHALNIIPEKIEKLRNLNCLPFLGQGEMGGSSKPCENAALFFMCDVFCGSIRIQINIPA